MAERGDVLRLRGDLAGAAAAYEAAVNFGYEPQPGLALLWLAQGRTAAAVAAVRRLLGETGDPVHRSRLLPAAVEVLLADGQADDAAGLAAELRSIAASFGCPSVQASADHASAAVALATGDPATALPLLRRERAVWERLGARYDTARCRVLLGRALRALGDDQSAVTELSAARRALAELGARPAEHEAAALIRPTLPARADRARGRGPAVGRGREDEPGDRCPAGAQREDRRSPPQQHLQQDRRHDADRRRRIRLRTPTRLRSASTTSVSTTLGDWKSGKQL